MADVKHFHDSLSEAAVPPHLDLALQGLWWAGKHEWHRGHACVQQHEGDPRCDWVHAHLHRVEATWRTRVTGIGARAKGCPPGRSRANGWRYAAALLASAHPAS